MPISNLIQKALYKINGIKYPQEYLCLALEKFQNQLNVYVIYQSQVLRNITDEHLFIGYKPLIIAIPHQDENNTESLEIAFCNEAFQKGNHLKRKERIATLSLKLICVIRTKDTYINYYQGDYGHHRFLNIFHKNINRLGYQLFNDSAGNIFLNGNLYDQVQIAYSIPRKICLITVGKNSLYNLFPTDLHGIIGNHYIISLRSEGNACKQVTDTKSILLSAIDVNYYKKVYALGKNHMKDLRESQNLDLSGQYSRHFNLPVPVGCLEYKELQLISSMQHGIHTLLLFKIQHRELLQTFESYTLSHIHAIYATWRLNNGFSTDYYIR